MNEASQLTLNVALNFNLDLRDTEDCYRIIRLLEETVKRSFVGQEDTYAMLKQIHKARSIVNCVYELGVSPCESPPEELG